jgi:hypothetical protein
MEKPVAAALLLLGLGGCATLRDWTSTHKTSADQQSLVGRFDGSYQGHVVALRRADAGCPQPHYGFVEIGDGMLSYAYEPGVVLQAPVSGDGLLHAQSGDVRLDGTINGRHMILSVASPACSYSYQLHYVWNHS